jgi:hypothetical protein
MKPFLMALIGAVFLVFSLNGAAGETALKQRTQSFTILLNGRVAEVTPLFGPVREAEWAPSWAPHFLQPTDGAQREGAVFTTRSSSGRERLWILTAYQPEAGSVAYVFVTPGFTVNDIKICVVADGDRRCKATITYRHSALSAEGNEEVDKLNQEWAKQQRVHWQTAINSVLAKGGAHE